MANERLPERSTFIAMTRPDVDRLDAVRLDGDDGVRVAGGWCRRRRGRQVFDHLLQ